jgi:tetratricopeptide (TPR) repeat protein
MGCSQTRIEPTADKSIEDDSHSKSAKPRPLPNQQIDRIVEDCIVIWLLNESFLGEVELEKSKLCHVVATIKMFTNRDECVTYIKNIRLEKIFLIIPAIESFLDSIQNLPQIEKIYVLNASLRETENNKNAITSPNIFYDIDSLCKQLETDVKLCELDLIVITTSPPPSQDATTSDSTKKQEALFLYGQLKREILYRLKFETNAKNEFINFCRLHYTNNIEQSRMIDDFEANYRPQKALWWLTRTSFICHILQRMQRTFEIDILYKLGFLLKHAHTQLNNFQENNSFISENLLIVYRGKTMFSDKFNALVKNNCGGLLSFSNFFTAHVDKEDEINFVRRRLTAFPNAIGILFEIYVNPTIRSVRSPFASLDKVHGDENIEKHGVLFGVCTVFHIDSIEQFTDESAITIWNIKLTLIADDDQQLLRLVAPLRSSEVQANPLSCMGKLFMEMGEYTQAEQFFLEMLQDASVRGQPRRLVRVHNGLGANYMHNGDYDKALQQYQQALNVSLSYLPPTHTDLASLYDTIGKSYFHLNEYQKAVENYERAADLIAQNAQLSNEQFVSDLNTRIDTAKKLLNKNKQ